MKKLLVVLLMIPLLGLSQEKNLLGLWDAYIVDCNELVADTILQSGTVNIEYVPVFAGKKVTHFNTVPVDTLWDKPSKCREYKNDIEHISEWGSPSFTNGGITLTGSISSNLTAGASYFTDPILKSQKLAISRNQVCMIKKQKASWEDFWNRWLVENKIISFN